MIIIKTAAEIEGMKPAGALSKLVLRHVGTMIRPGVETLELDRVAESIIRMHGGKPAFKGYGGFPASICCSINDEIVHGIPTATRVLQDGDIVSIDTGAVVNGWVGDNAWTFSCGTPSTADKDLCEITRDCLKAGIEQAVPGNCVGDIGHAVQTLLGDPRLRGPRRGPRDARGAQRPQLRQARPRRQAPGWHGHRYRAHDLPQGL